MKIKTEWDGVYSITGLESGQLAAIISACRVINNRTGTPRGDPCLTDLLAVVDRWLRSEKQEVSHERI